jgi:hypothetical protein
MRTLVAVITGLSIIITGFVIGKAYNFKYSSINTVSVIGGADFDFSSDMVVWSAAYSRANYELKTAYAALKEDEQQVRAYLIKGGIADSEIVASAIVIDKQFTYSYGENGNITSTNFAGYLLRQTVKVNSRSLDKVERISREITELLQSGIELSSEPPLYYYTKLSDLKIKLLEKATEDARVRAESIATNADSDLGKLKKASMGVFQITGQYSNEDYTYGGAFNTKDREKTASITVRLEYELD